MPVRLASVHARSWHTNATAPRGALDTLVALSLSLALVLLLGKVLAEQACYAEEVADGWSSFCSADSWGRMRILCSRPQLLLHAAFGRPLSEVFFQLFGAAAGTWLCNQLNPQAIVLKWQLLVSALTTLVCLTGCLLPSVWLESEPDIWRAAAQSVAAGAISLLVSSRMAQSSASRLPASSSTFLPARSRADDTNHSSMDTFVLDGAAGRRTPALLRQLQQRQDRLPPDSASLPWNLLVSACRKSVSAISTMFDEVAARRYRYRSAVRRMHVHMKIWGAEPNDLSCGLVGSLGSAVAPHGLVVVGTVVRAGCIEVVVELATSVEQGSSRLLPMGPAPQEVGLAALSALNLDWNQHSSISTSGPGSGVHVVVNSHRLHTSFNAKEKAWTQVPAPARTGPRVKPPTLHAISPLCVARAANARGSVQLLVHGSGFDSGVSFVAHYQGRFLEVQSSIPPPAERSAPSCEIEMVARDAAPSATTLLVRGVGGRCGLVRVEALRGGMLSGAGRGVLVVPEMAVAEEVTMLEAELYSARRAGNKEAMQALYDFIADLGLWLEYVDLILAPPRPPARATSNNSTSTAGSAAASTWASNLTSASLATVMTDASSVAPACELSAELRTLFQQQEYEALMRRTAARLLGCAAERGWQSTSKLIVRGLVGVGCTLSDIARELADQSDDLSLLHHAVLSQSAEMVDAVLSWGVEAPRAAPLLPAGAWKDALMSWTSEAEDSQDNALGPAAAGQWEARTFSHGLSPLHVAAALPDRGALAQHILEKYPAARAAWRRVRDANGTTPASVAHLVGNGHVYACVWHRLTKAKVAAAFTAVVKPAVRGRPLAQACLFGFPSAATEESYLHYATSRARWFDSLTMILVNVFGLALLLRVARWGGPAEAGPHLIWLAGYVVTGLLMWMSPARFALHRERLALFCAACRYTCMLWICSAMQTLPVTPAAEGQRAAWQTIEQYYRSAGGYRALLGTAILPALCEQVRVPQALILYISDVVLAGFLALRVEAASDSQVAGTQQLSAGTRTLVTLATVAAECGAVLAIKCIRDARLRRAFMHLEGKYAKAC